MAMLDRQQISECLATEWQSQSRAKGMGCLWKYGVVHVNKLVRRWNPAPLRRGTLVHAAYEAALLWDWAARHLNGLGTGQALSDLPEDRAPSISLGAMLAIGERALREKQAGWLADPKVAPAVDDAMRESAARGVEEAVKVFRRSFAVLGVHTGEWETVAAPNGKPFIEYQLDIPLDGWAGFRGTLDWVARDRRGHVWVWDFKTRKVLSPTEADQHQIQAPCYQHMLKEQLDVHLVGTITYQIRACVRKVPKLNKTKPKGATVYPMSRAACATDWGTYCAALIAADLDPEDYLDMKDKLPAAFDRIERYYRGPHEVAAVWQTVVELCATLAEAHRAERFPRNINPFTCRGCSHRTLCETDLQNGDVAALLETDYVVEGQDPRYPAVTVEDDEAA